MNVATPPPPRAVLFDRDGTLVVDVPYNGDPRRVEVMPVARRVLDGLRSAGVRVGVVTNQSAIGRGLITVQQAQAVNAEIERQLGDFDVWEICPHREDEGCGCRKPRPGMLLSAAAKLGLAPGDLAMVGDIGADVEAARAAGSRSVLVPTAATRAEEIDSAGAVADDLEGAMRVLGLAP
ncbi:haloacid dehalogenase [Subtercola sp. Z020]|uniref:D-glycero-alpha-D-manno-heptose-1,7-bisphosphate 7-phosphatase n=1 Tax=Subtercola sp. Z020 TaxID=2080582 RepID=UPI000CE76849|nr:HAD-IIIA family hydrolase [Subtercola sp. Z020]PPF87840.1 haloacid dehalogenase [Subtercola sp. Z020]